MVFRAIGLTAVLMSWNAFACPDLKGHYSCANDEVGESIIITQDGKENSSTITLNDSELLIDDSDHPITDDPTFRNAIMRISCTDAVVRRHVRGDFYEGQKKIGEIDSTTEYSLDKGDLVETTIGRMSSVSGDTPLDEKIVCQRASD